MEDKNKCYTDLKANRSDSEYVEGLKTWYKKASATFYSTTALREKRQLTTEAESIFFQAQFCQRNSMLFAMEMLHFLSSSLRETSFYFSQCSTMSKAYFLSYL